MINELKFLISIEKYDSKINYSLILCMKIKLNILQHMINKLWVFTSSGLQNYD